MTGPIRLAVVGGHRGGGFATAMEALADRIQLAAVCDLDERVLARWAELHPGIRTTTDYGSLLENPAVDAVLLATPMMLHARQTVQALEAGKHVLSEVIAATTLEECWELVETVERTGLTYMMAENYCYRRPTMMVRNMAERGVFGELTFAEGAYIHDTRDLLLKENGERAWRGFREATSQIARGNPYPTHSLGPVSQWLGITRGDRFLRTTTFVTKSVTRHEWAMSVLDRAHPDASPEAWAHAADSASTLIETERGRVIVLRKDSASPRPHNMVHYGLQGSRGAFVSQRHDKEDPLVWIDGVSPGSSPWNPGYEGMLRPPGLTGPAEWQTLWELSEQYEHPRWREHGDTARRAGHGGGDYFVIEDFINAVRDRRPPAIDVYDAVTWSCITPLSVMNVKNNGIPFDVPDFLRGRRRPVPTGDDAGVSLPPVERSE